MLDQVFWWTGLLAWAVGAVAFWLFISAWAIDRYLIATGFRRDFIAWWFDRHKARHPQHPA